MASSFPARETVPKSEQEMNLPPVQNLKVAAENDTSSSSMTSLREASRDSTPLIEPPPNCNSSSSDPQSSSGSKEGNTGSMANIATPGVAGATVANAAPTSTSPGEPISTPFEAPLPTCQPRTRLQLTLEQQNKYSSLLSTVEGWTELPTGSRKADGETSPLNDVERMFLTRECLLRYLRATAWSTSHAAQRLRTTLIWRREFGADALTADFVAPENETGKQVILGFDNEARPCLYLDPSRQNTNKSERQIQHLVFMLDRVIEMMHPDQETTALLINFKGSTTGGNPSVSQGRQVLNILQGHYPERLGKALISDLPWYVTTFFKLISPFIDPVTRDKMIFNQPLRDKYVPAAQLWKNHGGDANFEYDHKIYWPALNDLCQKRRAAYTERWAAAGKRVGEYEAYLRGGVQKPRLEAEQSTAIVQENLK